MHSVLRLLIPLAILGVAAARGRSAVDALHFPGCRQQDCAPPLSQGVDVAVASQLGTNRRLPQ